jgi:hypothetical protein
MSLTVIFLFLFAGGIYWFVTQILPERRRVSLIRPGVGAGLLGALNERRHRRGLPILEIDDELAAVAENKAVHQLMTDIENQGWDYPADYQDLFGRSLLLEMLLSGPMNTMAERLARQREAFDSEWVRCGIGVAGGQSGQVVVAVILCREAWETIAEEPAVRSRRRSPFDWLALGK